MKLKISNEGLTKTLSVLQKVIPAKPGLDIIGCFDMKLNGNILTCCATDGDMLVMACIETKESMQEGRIAVKANICDFLRTLPKEDIELSSDETKLTVRWATGESSLPIMDPECFPTVKKTDSDAPTLELPATTLNLALEKTINEVSNDMTNKQALCGIYFDTMEDCLSLVGADSNHLAVVVNPTVASNGMQPFILAKKAASLLKAITDRNPANAVIQNDGTRMTFGVGAFMLICPAMTYKYPRYRDLIPNDYTKVLRADRNEVIDVLKRMVMMSGDNRKVILDMTHDHTEVTAKDFATGVNAKDTFGADYTGEPMVACFKLSNLLSLLQNLTSPKMEIRMVAQNRAALIIPIWEDSKDTPTEVYKGLVMPVSV